MDMDMMNKVEMLREKANITYEEAKRVLDEADGDLLEAMILLERRGKVRKPETDIAPFVEEDTASEEKNKTKEKAADEKKDKKVKNTMKKIMNVLKNNSFCIYRKGEELFKMPVWAFALILFFFWEPVIPIMIIALFFDVRYAFTGKDDLSGANRFMDKAGEMADEMSSEFKTA
ncbi:MAG: hypothetical protein IJ899_11545 [Blautia sp.]|nr:hypothetical protein [Blautia sp.]